MNPRTPVISSLVAFGAAVPIALAQGGADWRTAEGEMLADHVQITFSEDFVKAGEAYFDAKAGWIIFQAIPRPAEGEEADEFYSMYVAKLKRDDEGNISGIEEPIRVSPEGTANTCGYFHPKWSHFIMFGSTIEPPTSDDEPGYQRDSGRYRWAFPPEMEVCKTVVEEIFRDYNPESPIKEFPDRLKFGPIFERPGYDAECSSSPDAYFIVHSSVDPDTGDADLFVYDSIMQTRTALVQKPGYDGGPFFSPNGQWVCYRSDREGNNLLQLFVARVAYGTAPENIARQAPNYPGPIMGIEEEIQLTDNRHVNWAPFWHPSGEFLVYTTSEMGHHNYEVFSIEFEPGKPMEHLAKRRITHAEGFDGLPVFSNDGEWMMWTSQRAGDDDSSQIWVARVLDVEPE